MQHAARRFPAIRPVLLGGAALVGLSMVAGAVFGGWAAQGPALFEALSANGLAWCF